MSIDMNQHMRSIIIILICCHIIDTRCQTKAGTKKHKTIIAKSLTTTPTTKTKTTTTSAGSISTAATNTAGSDTGITVETIRAMTTTVSAPEKMSEEEDRLLRLGPGGMAEIGGSSGVFDDNGDGDVEPKANRAKKLLRKASKRLSKVKSDMAEVDSSPEGHKDGAWDKLSQKVKKRVASSKEELNMMKDEDDLLNIRDKLNNRISDLHVSDDVGISGVVLSKIGLPDEPDMSANANSTNSTQDSSRIWTRMKMSVYNKYLKACYPDIGCFRALEVTGDGANRPLPVLPMSPDEISPDFHMYTINSRSDAETFGYNVSESQLKASLFNPKLRTAFIIHGFKSGYAQWMENLKDFILLQSKNTFNVVVVVWEKGSKVTFYNQAASNTRLVGALVAHFIKKLCKTFNTTNDMFSLIGHSLGAHTSGFVGKLLNNPKLAQITGLDPAGVGFHYKNRTNERRLHPNDAEIVDVIHTDSALTYTEGFGTEELLGHYDFYPNGGNWQPGCPKTDNIASKLTSLMSMACSHSRACLIARNINMPEDTCSTVAYQCETYETFLEGRCNDCREERCQLMGINYDYWHKRKARDTSVDYKYFVNTGDKEDYCLFHYQMALHTSADSDLNAGYFIFNFNTTVNNESVNFTFKRIMSRTDQNRTHTLLLTIDYRIDKLLSLVVEWRRFNVSDPRESKRLNRGMSLKIPVIELNFMSHMNESVRDQYSTVLCPVDGPDTRIIANYMKSYKTTYKECDQQTDIGIISRDVGPDQLIPFTRKEDIYSVHYQNLYPQHRKVAGSTLPWDS